MMSKVELAIKFLKYMAIHQKATREQLATYLETTPRKIVDIKKELSLLGYQFQSVRGKHGYYYYDGKYDLPIYVFSEEQWEAIYELPKFLTTTNYPYIKEIQTVCTQLQLTREKEKKVEIIYFNDQENIQASYSISGKDDDNQNFAKRIIKKVDYAIKNNKKIEITYQSSNRNYGREYRLDPYEILFYNHYYYFLAYHIEEKKFKLFKISKHRLLKFEVLDNLHFYRKENFNINLYKGDYQLVKSNLLAVEFIVFEPLITYAKEISFGIDEQKEVVENGLKVSVKVEGILGIREKLLSMGSCVQVLKPQELKESIIDEIRKMAKNYEDIL